MPFHSPNSVVYILATSSSYPASYLLSVAQLQAANLQRGSEAFCHKPLSLNREYLFQILQCVVVCRSWFFPVWSAVSLASHADVLRGSSRVPASWRTPKNIYVGGYSFAFTFTTFEYFYRLDDDRVEGRLGKSIKFMSFLWECVPKLFLSFLFLFSRCNQTKFAFVPCIRWKVIEIT